MVEKDTEQGNSEYLIVHIGSEFPERFETFMEDTKGCSTRGTLISRFHTGWAGHR
jgi:hypothetical protein